MTERRPGPDLDVEVHRALWPDARIERRWCWLEPECGTWTEMESQYEWERTMQKPPVKETERHRRLWCWAERLTDAAGVEYDEWHIVPAYSTDLSAWDWERAYWEWQIAENYHDVDVILFVGVAHDVEEGDSFHVWVSHNDGSRFKIQAFVRTLCVLQWAERRAEG